MALLGIYCTYQTEIKMLLDEITFKLPLLIFLYKVFKKNCAFFPILSNQLLALLSLQDIFKVVIAIRSLATKNGAGGEGELAKPEYRRVLKKKHIFEHPVY